MSEPNDRQQLLDNLESYVDSYGIRRVVVALSLICSGKAEHVAMNWQDTTTAKIWDKWAVHLDRAAAFKQPDPLEP